MTGPVHPPRAPRVLYLDNHLIGIEKPAGFLSQPDETGDDDVTAWVARMLKERFDKPGNVYVGLVHRLDRPVSGAMIVARTSKAARRLAEAFRTRAVAKRYLAVVAGDLTGEGDWEDRIVRRGARAEVLPIAAVEGAVARTHYERLAGDGSRTLVELSPQTGRYHQLRAQAAHRGHPIVGDLRYGSGAPRPDRSIALHCASIACAHPVKKEPFVLKSPPPEAWGEWFGLER